MYQLSDEDCFAQGRYRKCFTHEDFENCCIKIQKPEYPDNNQNKVEHIYLRYLNFRKIPYQNVMPEYKGIIKTNFGEGLVFETITDFDGENAKSLKYYLMQGIVSVEQAEAIINQLSKDLTDLSIVNDDKNLENILMKRTNDSSFKAVLVDGFGAKRMGIKFFFSMLFPAYARFKTKKRAEQLITYLKYWITTI